MPTKILTTIAVSVLTVVSTLTVLSTESFAQIPRVTGKRVKQVAKIVKELPSQPKINSLEYKKYKFSGLGKFCEGQSYGISFRDYQEGFTAARHLAFGGRQIRSHEKVFLHKGLSQIQPPQKSILEHPQNLQSRKIETSNIRLFGKTDASTIGVPEILDGLCKIANSPLASVLGAFPGRW